MREMPTGVGMAGVAESRNALREEVNSRSGRPTAGVRSKRSSTLRSIPHGARAPVRPSRCSYVSTRSARANPILNIPNRARGLRPATGVCLLLERRRWVSLDDGGKDASR